MIFQLRDLKIATEKYFVELISRNFCLNKNVIILYFIFWKIFREINLQHLLFIRKIKLHKVCLFVRDFLKNGTTDFDETLHVGQACPKEGFGTTGMSRYPLIYK